MSELEDKINSVLGDPQQMEQITKLAKSLMGGGPDNAGEEKQPGSLPAGLDGLGIDASALQRLSRIMGKGGAEKPRERALLEAMKPYLSDERRGKMDKALKLARLAKLAGLAMGEMGGDGAD